MYIKIIPTGYLFLIYVAVDGRKAVGMFLKHKI